MSKKLCVGIVGLPNVGKSTLFNSITKLSIPAQNYPFCTIDPNKGIISIPDSRLNNLAKISNSENIIPASIEFVDIAGLVKGASKGEGLGNQFLSHIRSTSVIAQVVRCFDSKDITHVDGKVDPVKDYEIITDELILSDLSLSEKLIQGLEKKSKTNDPGIKKEMVCLQHVHDNLSQGHVLRDLDFSDDDLAILLPYDFLTIKKQIVVANTDEVSLINSNSYIDDLKSYMKQKKQEVIVVCAALEEECVSLTEEEKSEFLAESGITSSGLDLLAVTCFDLLGLQTFFTSGKKETRSWTISKGIFAPDAAGVIHTDFQTGFIRANVISYDDFVSSNGQKVAKEKGLLRQEGKDYIVQDGDVIEFLFNV